MTAYQIALAIHLFALIAAATASGIVHLAAGRRAAAPTLRQSMEWAKLAGTTARVFPLAVITLVASGGFMVTGRWSWQAGWVEAGLMGAILLFVSGATIGRRGAAQGRANVQRLQSAGHDLPNDGAPDRLAAVLTDANTGLALAIVLVMTLKPGLAGALGTLAFGAASGALIASRQLRARSAPAAMSRAEAA